jgi:predicted GNAT family N-acyltransferase
MNMQIEVKSPNDCNSEELNNFERIVVEAGQVQAVGFRDLMLNAYRLIFIKVNGKLVATGAIKVPRESYKKDIFEKAGVSELLNKYKYEIGWIFVSISQRRKGFSTEIVKALIEVISNHGCYATTKSNNIGMHTIFDKMCFEKLGNDYQSSNGDYNLRLFGISS